MSKQTSISNNPSQIKQLFSVRQKNVPIQQINKFLQSHKQTQLSNFDYVKQISFSTYQIWQKAKQPDVNGLLQIQIYEQFQSQRLKKPEQFDKLLQVANEHLARISKQKIIEEIMKQICELPHQGHIYIRYRETKKQKQQKEKGREKQKSKTEIKEQSKIQQQKDKKVIEKPSSQKTSSVKEQKREKQSQNEDNKARLNKPEISSEKQIRKHQQAIIQQIMNNFYMKEEISVEEIKLLQQKATSQCNVQLLKQYKKSLSKAIDSKQVSMSFLGYETWNKQRIDKKQSERVSQEKQKQQKQAINVQSQNKVEQSKQNIINKVAKQKKSEGKVLNLLEKYLKDNKYGNKDKQRNQKLRLQIDYLSQTQLINPLEFQIKVMFGDKYIDKYLTEMIGKKLLKSQQQPYLIIELETKKGQILQQKIQQIMKDSNHNIQDLQLVTVSQKTKLFISIPYKNDQQFRKIHDLVKEQCSGSIEMTGKFALGNDEKIKPQDCKLIKCIAKGFNFMLESQGNNQFNHRFRKNLQLQNRDSMFFQLLCLTKNSEIKLKLKKLQDLNSFFGKLGIADAIKTTPSIKEIVQQLFLQIFEFNEALSIYWLISEIISGAESAKIRLTKTNNNTLITASLHQPDILHQFFPK